MAIPYSWAFGIFFSFCCMRYLFLCDISHHWMCFLRLNFVNISFKSQTKDLWTSGLYYRYFPKAPVFSEQALHRGVLSGLSWSTGGPGACFLPRILCASFYRKSFSVLFPCLSPTLSPSLLPLRPSWHLSVLAARTAQELVGTTCFLSADPAGSLRLWLTTFWAFDMELRGCAHLLPELWIQVRKSC